MEIDNILLLIIIFAILLAVLVIFYGFKPSKKKPKAAQKSSVKPKVQVPTFAELLKQVKTKSTSSAQLAEAAELILKYYGTIKDKHGVMPDSDFQRYGEVIFAICSHPNTTKEIVVSFDRELRKRNPQYDREIEEMLNRGLSAR